MSQAAKRGGKGSRRGGVVALYGLRKGGRIRGEE